MKIAWLAAAAALASCAVLLSAGAQTGLPAPATRASAPRPAKPVPRALTPAELRDSAGSPLDEATPGPIIPQVIIPLGKAARAEPKPTWRAAGPARASSAAKINDAAAHCKALSNESERATCRLDASQRRRGN